MVSLTQVGKVAEMEKEGYLVIERRHSAPTLGGPCLMAKTETTLVKVYADGSIESASQRELATW